MLKTLTIWQDKGFPYIYLCNITSYSLYINDTNVRVTVTTVETHSNYALTLNDSRSVDIQRR